MTRVERSTDNVTATSSGASRAVAGFFQLPKTAFDALYRSWGASRLAPLVLELPTQTITFNSTEDFEFCLESRTDFPVRKVDELMPWSAAELRRTAIQIRQVEKRFAEVLQRAIDTPDAVSDLLHSLDIKLFSQDHCWRDIVDALNQLSPKFDAYKKLAIVKYMQYLASRQNIVKSIYLEKTSPGLGSITG